MSTETEDCPVSQPVDILELPDSPLEKTRENFGVPEITLYSPYVHGEFGNGNSNWIDSTDTNIVQKSCAKEPVVEGPNNYNNQEKAIGTTTQNNDSGMDDDHVDKLTEFDPEYQPKAELVPRKVIEKHDFFDPDFEASLPESHCSYCCMSKPEAIVQCNICQRWFCNSSLNTSGSHILNHLVRSRHKSISLHKDSTLCNSMLECYICGGVNVFMLGFMPSKIEEVVVLVCREPCVLNFVAPSPVPNGFSGQLKSPDFPVTSSNSEWDGALWTPLVTERSLLSWLVEIPTEDTLQAEARFVATAHINRLEEFWRKESVDSRFGQLRYLDVALNTDVLQRIQESYAAQMSAVEGPPVVVDGFARNVQLTYADGFEYQSIFAPLVDLEGKLDKELKDGRRLTNVTLRWDPSTNGNKCCYIPICSSLESQDVKLVPGDEVILMLKGWKESSLNAVRARSVNDILRSSMKNSSLPTGDGVAEVQNHAQETADWVAIGHVTKCISQSEEVCVELRPCQPNTTGPWDVTTGFIVDFVWRATGFARMKKALHAFSNDETCVSNVIYQQLIGCSRAHKDSFIKNVTIEIRNPPRDGEWSAPNLPRLNHSQASAVSKVLHKPLSLIQGPPGTGKSVTSASIVYHLSRQGRGQVLVTAPSNIAVDQLTEKIHLTGLRVLRLYAKTREYIPSSVDFLSMKSQISILDTPQAREYRKLDELREKMGELPAKDDKRFRSIRHHVESELIQTADVVCATCVGAGDPRLKKVRFKMVVIDECTQATEPEALIPICKGAKQIILVGDHKQLGPVVMCKKAAMAGYKQSLFERLILGGMLPMRLEVQYRMHPALAEFPSVAFYEGALQNGISVYDRQMNNIYSPWPNPEIPLFFYNSTGKEEISSSGTSFLNRSEALNIERILTHLIKSGVRGEQIGVITPYEGQRAYIQQILQRSTTLGSNLYEPIEIASVDAFQGREKDFIVVSCVRSNETSGLGFLNDPRRLNVAITRAKYGLVICGNAEVLVRPQTRIGKSSGVSRHLNVWSELLSFLKNLDLVVEGPLSDLKTSTVKIPDMYVSTISPESSSPRRQSSSMVSNLRYENSHSHRINESTAISGHDKMIPQVKDISPRDYPNENSRHGKAPFAYDSRRSGTQSNRRHHQYGSPENPQRRDAYSNINEWDTKSQMSSGAVDVYKTWSH